MNKNVRTKIKRTERIEIRVTSAFKKSLEEMSVQNGTSLSKLIEEICTEKIKDYFSTIKTRDFLSSPPVRDGKQSGGKTHRAEYEREIWRMMLEGMTPTQSADWLNKNGFKPQRGEQFTLNSVHSIRKRLKKERGSV